MAVSKRLRTEILRRDNHACRYCGGTAPDVRLTIDHVLPIALGGTDDATNLVAACADCNAGKSASAPGQPLVEQVSQDHINWAMAVRQAASQAVEQAAARDLYVDTFNNVWNSLTYGYVQKYTYPRPDDWEKSIGTFYARQMPMELLADAATIAVNNGWLSRDRVWRYFLGVAWNKLSEIEAAAKAIMFANQVDRDA